MDPPCWQEVWTLISCSNSLACASRHSIGTASSVMGFEIWSAASTVCTWGKTRESIGVCRILKLYTICDLSVRITTGRTTLLYKLSKFMWTPLGRSIWWLTFPLSEGSNHTASCFSGLWQSTGLVSLTTGSMTRLGLAKGVSVMSSALQLAALATAAIGTFIGSCFW